MAWQTEKYINDLQGQIAALTAERDRYKAALESTLQAYESMRLDCHGDNVQGENDVITTARRALGKEPPP